MLALNLIQPSMYLKTRIFLIKFAANNILLRKTQYFDTILSFFDSIKADTVLSQRIIGVLPNEIHQVYLTERESAQSRP